MEYDTQEKVFIRDFGLLSLKPACYLINVSDTMGDDAVRSLVEAISQDLGKAGDRSPVLSVNALLESEIALISPEERDKFLEGFGIAKSGRDRVIRTTYDLLSLITFFTVGEDECRSWQIRNGATAVDAAAAIHTDLARGFIRAEVIEYDALLELGSFQDARKMGKLRLEGKSYVVKDGEIVHIMFNV
jgi:ribosome-binding ATPase YchF (GTP1/OBG family)